MIFRRSSSLKRHSNAQQDINPEVNLYLLIKKRVYNSHHTKRKLGTAAYSKDAGGVFLKQIKLK